MMGVLERFVNGLLMLEVFNSMNIGVRAPAALARFLAISTPACVDEVLSLPALTIEA
jgi:hypothetical protein